jgi:tetratricopeptide (TPR) repeat protein
VTTSTSGRGRAYYQQVARWMSDAAEALFYAHSEGIIHRDIKPGNLILCMDGRIMVTDFGLAKSDNEQSVTVTGALLGTVRYLSPEQAMARRIPVDHRTDIYSLGATMYELLCFEPAFPGSDEKQVLSAIITRDPTPTRKILRLVPQELETICLKALERDPNARYQTGRAFADDLRRFLNDLPIEAKKPGVARRARKFVKRHKAATIAAAGLLSVSGFVFLWRLEAGRRETADAARLAADVDSYIERAENEWITERNRAKASRLYRDALRLQPDNAQALGNLASVLREQFELGEDKDPALVEEAIRACERAQAGPNPPARLANTCGVLYAIKGDFSKAYELFEAEARTNPTSPQPWFNIGLIAYLQGDLNRAEESIRKSIDVAAANNDRWQAHPWRELATLQLDDGRTEALETLELGLSIGHGGSPLFYLVRARIRLTPGTHYDPAKALQDAINADELADPKHPKIKRYLGLAYLKNAEFEKARSEAHAAIEMHDLEVFNRLVLAMAEDGLGNRELAAKEIEAAEKCWPPNLRQPGVTQRGQDNGLLWFEKSDELLALHSEAASLLERR